MNNFCYLAYDCKFKIPENVNLPIPREKHIGWYEYDADFYVEQYEKIEDLIDRLKHIYSLYIKKAKDKNIDIYSEECSYNQFFVSNEMDEYMLVGLNPYGWDISIVFFGYLYKYFLKHYGKEKVWEMLHKKTEKGQVWLYSTTKSEPYIRSARDSVSEETATIILKNFVEGMYEDNISLEVYYREIEKRNYLK